MQIIKIEYDASQISYKDNFSDKRNRRTEYVMHAYKGNDDIDRF